jgi:hemolysin-activating ACP:hemolysin acyltransferase
VIEANADKMHAFEWCSGTRMYQPERHLPVGSARDDGGKMSRMVILMIIVWLDDYNDGIDVNE